MVWINDQHINHTVAEGVCGGSICLCIDCEADRRLEKENKWGNKNLNITWDREGNKYCGPDK